MKLFVNPYTKFWTVPDSRDGFNLVPQPENQPRQRQSILQAMGGWELMAGSLCHVS
jgi:hypothetical protein